jgi:hypothetical protein
LSILIKRPPIFEYLQNEASRARFKRFFAGFLIEMRGSCVASPERTRQAIADAALAQRRPSERPSAGETGLRRGPPSNDASRPLSANFIA